MGFGRVKDMEMISRTAAHFHTVERQHRNTRKCWNISFFFVSTKQTVTGVFLNFIYWYTEKRKEIFGLEPIFVESRARVYIYYTEFWESQSPPPPFFYIFNLFFLTEFPMLNEEGFQILSLFSLFAKKNYIEALRVARAAK